jgi:hypothetical protein
MSHFRHERGIILTYEASMQHNLFHAPPRVCLFPITVTAQQPSANGDKFAPPPHGFDVRRADARHRKLETIEYNLTTAGAKRKASDRNCALI